MATSFVALERTERIVRPMSVVVVTGAGGIGLACARRLASGRRLLLAEADPQLLETAVTALEYEGFDVEGHEVDVTDPDAIRDLARAAGAASRVAVVVHTAGLSPTMASGRRILTVNLEGTAFLIDAFENVVGDGTVGVMIASMAGHLWPMDPLTEQAIAVATAAEAVAATGLPDDVDSSTAYAVSKRGVIARVAAAAPRWGRRGARIVSVSPGIIATSMGHREAAATPIMDEMRKQSPLPRLGTPADIAEAVAWLTGPEAAFITGTDLLVDGGVVASMRGWS
jgi:NAD(P)-dependent dehydrogenase (short-subunit alcohol dehydrogenase family)